MVQDPPFDYDAERRRIEDEHRRDLELLEAARRAKLAALEAMREAESRRAAAQADGFAPLSPPAAPPAANPRRKRADNYAALDAVVSALDRIEGEVFDRNDLLRQMEDAPERSSLYKTLDRMVDDRLLAIEEYGSGRSPARYRLLVARSALPRPG